MNSPSNRPSDPHDQRTSSRRRNETDPDEGDLSDIKSPALIIKRENRFVAIAKKILPTVAYSSFFFTVFVLSVYWSFPWDRVRDKISAEFDKGQKIPPGGSRQVLTIGKLEPSWFTGVVLRDIALTSVPADPTKPPTTLKADELRVRVAFGSLLSTWKDMTFHATALGGTIDGSVTYKPTTDLKEAERRANDKSDKKGPRPDRFIKIDLEGLSLGEIAPVRELIGAPIGGTLRGNVDITVVGLRTELTGGTVKLDIENFWVSDGKTPFKIPALKAFFGSEDITLPQIRIGNVPIQVDVKNGVARVTKFEGKGADLDLAVAGGITLRENSAESDMNLLLQFKFNDSYKKKGDATAGLLMVLDQEPKLKASKRPDGFYALRMAGLLSATPAILPAGAGAGAFPSPGLRPGMIMPATPMTP